MTLPESDFNQETQPHTQPKRPSSVREAHWVDVRTVTFDRKSYTSGQAARLLQIPERTMRRYLSLGKIHGEQHPITGTWRITKEALARFVLEKCGQEAPAAVKTRVLLVHSDAAFVKTLKQAVERQPNTAVHISLDACDALIHVGATLPDLVIVDAQMPVLSGKEILLAIRNNPRTSQINVAVCGSDSPEEPDLLRLGADSVLRRSLTDEELALKLSLLLGRCQARKVNS